MKAIAILTDFSTRAENAANYALLLAQSVQADLVIYDSFSVASAEKFRHNNKHELQLFADRLRKSVIPRQSIMFRPAISCRRHEGNSAVTAGELATNKTLILLVMASHDKSIASLLLGDDVRELLDTTTLPLLIIRDQHAFRRISHIAFTTDWAITDIAVIQALVSLAQFTDARITLIPIGVGAMNEDLIIDFMTALSAKTDYPHIGYRKMISTTIMDEITGLDVNNTYDMLVMVHRHKGFWEALFNRSDTQKMATQISLPLLLYPYPALSLPDFFSSRESADI